MTTTRNPSNGIGNYLGPYSKHLGVLVKEYNLCYQITDIYYVLQAPVMVA